MLLNNPIISLIIPIYNVENFLEQTLNSITKQTFKDFEVIMVNDGSTDKSWDIMRKFEKTYPNFKAINQENKGPGPARNLGILNAIGEYIAFMDSDDYIEPNFLEKLYNNMQKYDADICCCNYKLYFPESNIKFHMPIIPKSKVYDNENALKKLILDITMHHFVWNKLFKRSLFFNHNIEFANMYFEDIATMPQLFLKANKIVVINDVLYHYILRKPGIMWDMNPKKINDFIRSLGSIKAFLVKNNVYDQYKTHFKIYAYRVKLFNYFYISRMHAINNNFNGIINNFKKSNHCVKFIKYNHSKHQADIPDLPHYIKSPEKKTKKFQR